MPRIPSREEPYHSVAKCNRHWKTKREFVTKAANKASHVDGSHYLLVCVTPKGNIEVHASEHFYDDTNQQRSDGVINWDLLRKRATLIQNRNEERWAEVERQEKRFGVEGDEDAASDDDEGLSLTDIVPPPTAGSGPGGAAPAPGQLMSTFSATKPQPARPIGSLQLTPDVLEQEYCSRFEHLGQSVCANVLKAWIKVVEPKKQTKYPYKDKKGNEGRPPPWWPVGMRHIEPDHLHKDERPRLLTSIVMQASRPRIDGPSKPASPENRELTISRLHFATAEIASTIPPRQHYELRQIYLIAKEVRKVNEDRRRERIAAGLPPHNPAAQAWSEMTIEFYEKPPTAAAAKRSFDVVDFGGQDNKENIDFDARPIKRGKSVASSDIHSHALTPLASHTNVYATSVHSYPIDAPHTPHTTSSYASWPTGATPITTTVPASVSSTQQTSATPLSASQHQQQQQQQQQYYRSFADVNYQASPTAVANTASTTPTYHSQTQYQQGYYQPVYSGYHAGYQQSQQHYASNTGSAASYAYDQAPGFVGDLGGLSA